MPRTVAYWFLDFFLFLLILMVEGILLGAQIQPLKRSFDCRDASIQKPVIIKQSVDATALFTGVILTAVVIGVCEALRHTLLRSPSLQHLNEEMTSCGRCAIKHWQRRAVLVMFMYFFGAMFTWLVTDIGKLLTGRLRPNFLALCQPKQANCTVEFSDDACKTSPEILYYGRRSFPSGHASVSTFCMVYFALYLEAFIRTKRSNLLKVFVQLAALCLALYTSLSRVYDYWHHLADVLAGMLLGAVVAVFLVFKPLRMFSDRSPTIQPVANNNPKDTEEAVPRDDKEAEQLTTF